MLNGTIADLQDVSKIYPMGELPVGALKKVSITIRNAEYIAIMGPSGSGKSTLLNILGGVDQPSEGSVYLGGVKIDSLPEKALLSVRRKTVSYIFQEARLLSSLTALENVILPLAFYSTKASSFKPKDRGMALLEKVGLAKRAGHLPHQLSGGEAQRVSIARALMNDPLLVLADEPTGNLDSKTGEEIMELFQNLNKEGLTIVMVTHDPQKASHAKRVDRLKDGEIVEDLMNHKFFIAVADHGTITRMRFASLDTDSSHRERSFFARGCPGAGAGPGPYTGAGREFMLRRKECILDRYFGVKSVFKERPGQDHQRGLLCPDGPRLGAAHYAERHKPREHGVHNPARRGKCMDRICQHSPDRAGPVQDL